MDRDALKRWLSTPHRTWRWNDGDPERYRGVETCDSGLRWFGWSHRFDEREDGLYGERIQSWDSFLRHGPLDPMPDDARAELEKWHGRFVALEEGGAPRPPKRAAPTEETTDDRTSR